MEKPVIILCAWSEINALTLPALMVSIDKHKPKKIGSVSSLAAVAQTDAQILILGSMPGELSLARQQYYAHPSNAFWKIMANLFDFNPDDNYADRLLALQQHKLALWDVIQSCERQGSLDSHISNASIISNNFVGFFQQHQQIKHIFSTVVGLIRNITNVLCHNFLNHGSR